MKQRIILSIGNKRHRPITKANHFPTFSSFQTSSLNTPLNTSLNTPRYYTTETNNECEENVSQSRTKIVAELWKKRAQLDHQIKSNPSSVSTSEITLLTKTPKDSYESIDFNFTTDKKLLLEYQSFMKGEVRYGRILEDLDAFAANIAHNHADDGNPHTIPLTIVTACVDRIDIVKKFPLGVDTQMEGNVVWVGTSSMLVKVRMIEKISKEEIMEATFLMVARDPVGKALAINKLQPESSEELLEYKEGAELIQRRKNEKNNSLDVKAPSHDEFKLIHSQFFPSSSFELNNSIAKERGQVLMADTKLQTVVLCHPQEKNTRERIFGGYLMRKAYELGESNAHLFCAGKAKPFLIAIGEITFLRPVEIGSIIRFDSFVTYSTTKACQIRVSTIIQDLVKRIEHTSNTFEFTFAFESLDENEPFVLPEVRPTTYIESMHFITGKRRFESSKLSASVNQTLLYPYFN